MDGYETDENVEKLMISAQLFLMFVQCLLTFLSDLPLGTKLNGISVLIPRI